MVIWRETEKPKKYNTETQRREERRVKGAVPHFITNHTTGTNTQDPGLLIQILRRPHVCLQEVVLSIYSATLTFPSDNKIMQTATLKPTGGFKSCYSCNPTSCTAANGSSHWKVFLPPQSEAHLRSANR